MHGGVVEQGHPRSQRSVVREEVVVDRITGPATIRKRKVYVGLGAVRFTRYFACLEERAHDLEM